MPIEPVSPRMKGMTRISEATSGRVRHDVGRDMPIERRRDMRSPAIPMREARHGLMQQHAEPTDDRMPGEARLAQKLRLEGRVDDVNDQCTRLQVGEPELVAGLPDHAERSGVDEEIDEAQQPVKL